MFRVGGLISWPHFDFCVVVVVVVVMCVCWLYMWVGAEVGRDKRFWVNVYMGYKKRMGSVRRRYISPVGGL